MNDLDFISNKIGQRDRKKGSQKERQTEKDRLTVRRIEITTERQTDIKTEENRLKDKHINRELQESTEGESLPP